MPNGRSESDQFSWGPWPEEGELAVFWLSPSNSRLAILLVKHRNPNHPYKMAPLACTLRNRALFRLAGISAQSARAFSTSFVSRKDTSGLKKLFDSAEQAVSDIPSGSTILSGGEERICRLLYELERWHECRLVFRMTPGDCSARSETWSKGD